MSIMTRGTTPTLTYNLGIDDANLIKGGEVYFSQDGVLRLMKSFDDDACTISDDGTLLVTLTQAETLRFNPEIKLETQVRIVYQNGSVEATNIVKDRVSRILKGGEINVD